MIERRGNCSSTGKACFLNRKAAKAFVARKHWSDVSVFKCSGCGYFHAGGWHGYKDRSQHREMHGEQAAPVDMPIPHAASFLRVSEDIVHRMIQAGKIRGTHTHANTTDIQRIHTQILRTQ